MTELPLVAPDVRERLAVRFGDPALAWCDDVPDLVSELSAGWNLDVMTAGGGGTSCVFRCLVRDTGKSAWLKITPDVTIAREEAEALGAWAETSSVVSLLAENTEAGALLLENVDPGLQVKNLTWGLSDVAVLLGNLREDSSRKRISSAIQPLSHRIDFLFDLAEEILTTKTAENPFDSATLSRARTEALGLAATGPTGLVHGDLHPGNVLSGPGNLMVAIDPRPAWGDPDFDAVDWVLDGAQDVDRLDERIQELADSVPGMSTNRVSAWCRPMAVLIAVPRIYARRSDAETDFLIGLANG
ncbi:aminoglycoside phosphotransferase family protein [Streptomyces sp. NPDC004436]